jgi:hypothetical protein
MFMLILFFKNIEQKMLHFKSAQGRGTIKFEYSHKGNAKAVSRLHLTQSRGDKNISITFNVRVIADRPIDEISEDELARIAVAQFELKTGSAIGSDETLDFKTPAWHGEFYD